MFVACFVICFVIVVLVFGSSTFSFVYGVYLCFLLWVDCCAVSLFGYLLTLLIIWRLGFVVVGGVL